MKRSILFLLIVFTIKWCAATDWFPVGAQWTWGSLELCCGPPPRPNVPFYWNAVKDTVIQNKTCTIVERSGYYYPQVPQWIYRYIFNDDSDRITRFINNTFLPVYDFNLSEGDSTYIVTDSGLTACDTFVFKIDSIRLLHEDTSLRVQYGRIHPLADCNHILTATGNLSIIEKIGLPYLITNSYFFVTDGDDEYVRCYNDSVTNINLWDADCDLRYGVSTWFPYGAKSYWGYRMCCGPEDDPYYWSVIKDTIIGSHDCRILLSNNGKRSIVTEDNGVVQKYVNGNFLSLYDFNKVAGDTVLFLSDSGKYSCDSFLFIIDSVRPLQQAPGLKVQYGKFKKNPSCIDLHPLGDYAYTRIVERMGVFRFEDISGYFSLEPDFSYERCYEDPSLNIHFVIYDCDTVLSRVKELRSSKLKIYPNPASDKIRLEYDRNLSVQVSIILMDIEGRILKEEVLQNNEIDVSHIPNGMYFLKIVINDEFITKSFIIQH